VLRHRRDATICPAADELRARRLELCVANTFEEHELEFPIAAFEAASARFRERLTAAALACGPAPQNDVWADHADAVAALSRLESAASSSPSR
jgi:hypothetical protein